MKLRDKKTEEKKKHLKQKQSIGELMSPNKCVIDFLKERREGRI